MGQSLRELKILDELYDEQSSDINLKRLARLLGLQAKVLAKALDISESVLSRKPFVSNNEALNHWLLIFNLIIDIILEAEPHLPSEQVKLRMQRWLKLPRPEFNNKTPIEFMISGKSRRVKNFLEQLLH
jgi:hypothetical protein